MLLLLLLGEENLVGAELLVPSERVDDAAAAVVEGGPLGSLLVLGHAVQQAVTRARQDFCFKGFGLTCTKSLVHRGFGVGFGIPLTPNFPAWERVGFLPTINSCVGVFFPFTISGWCSISYPADMVFRVLAKLAPHIPSPASASANDDDARYRSAATRAAAVAMANARRGLVATATAARARAKAATKGLRMAAAAKGSSTQKKGGRRRRRGSVERVGISISCRYNPSTGFFVRVTPWLFILPGLQLLARLLARLFNFVLGRVEELESRTARRPRASTSTTTAEAQARQEEEEKKRMQQEQEEQRALLASASARRFKVCMYVCPVHICTHHNDTRRSQTRAQPAHPTPTQYRNGSPRKRRAWGTRWPCTKAGWGPPCWSPCPPFSSACGGRLASPTSPQPPLWVPRNS